MSTTDINLMLAEKDGPCVSIILPTTRFSRARMQNPEHIEKAILKVYNLLNQSAWPKNDIANVQQKLNALLNRIDYMRLQEGLAIFISPRVSKMHLLPFTVIEKVILGRTFEIRDLIYFNQLLHPYYLLALSKKRVRLFKGSGRDLQEILNHDFPKVYVEEYEYERPSIASSSSPALKSFERDKSVLAATRTKTFFRHADNALKKYIRDESQLFIAGVEDEIADFENVSLHTEYIAGKINGNYDVDAVHPLAEIAWTKMKEYISVFNLKLVARLQENIGNKLAAEGICNVWRAAREGKGLTLLLEKDYQKRAFTRTGEEEHLFLTPPTEKHEIIPDAANDIIQIVKEKGGNVVILGNGELEKFQHIALLLRYAG